MSDTPPMIYICPRLLDETPSEASTVVAGLISDLEQLADQLESHSCKEDYVATWSKALKAMDSLLDWIQLATKVSSSKLLTSERLMIHDMIRSEEYLSQNPPELNTNNIGFSRRVNDSARLFRSTADRMKRNLKLTQRQVDVLHYIRSQHEPIRGDDIATHFRSTGDAEFSSEHLRSRVLPRLLKFCGIVNHGNGYYDWFEQPDFHLNSL